MTPEELHAALVARLRTIRTVTVYDTDVPTAPPADAQGRVYPYVVAWPAAGDPYLAERTVTVESGRQWIETVTVAAGNPAWVLPAVGLLRKALQMFELAPGVHADEEPTGQSVDKDPDVTPTRWYLPTQWRALTP